jgi:hypothetical protein
MYILKLVKKRGILVIILVLVIAVAAYFLLVRKGTTPLSNKESGEETLFSGSFKDLISKGTAQKCTFANDSGSGTLYVSATGKMRGDFDATVDGKPAKTHMIVDGKSSYIWSDGEKMGFKATFEPSEADLTATQQSVKTSSEMDANTKADYKCGLWITDASKFSLPEGIDFQSLESLMNTEGLGE